MLLPELSSIDFRLLRKNKRYSVKEVVALTGVPYHTVYNIEGGKVVHPSYETVSKLLNLYYTKEVL